MKVVLQKVIDDHRATMDRDNPRDLIDIYLLDMEEQQDDPKSILHGQFIYHSTYDHYPAYSIICALCCKKQH